MADESYRRAAWIYRGAGWAGVLPLPERAKWPPPRGYTGWAGVEPSGADVQAWVDGVEGDGNVCLHLPDGVYGLDVDEYGPKSGGTALHRLVDTLGALPPTWIASSRGESLSGIRVFRASLPAGRRWRNEPAGRGAGIESIHRGHRYAVVWPSWHPEGRQYLWRRPEGILAAEGEVPHLDALPILPDAWIEHLSEPGEARQGDMAGHHESIETITGWREGDACPRVAAAYDRATLALASARDGAELHPTATSQVFELVNLGHEGHAGVRAALAAHYGLFVEIRSEREGGGATARGRAENEWWRMVRGAVGKLQAGAGRERCDCGLWAGEGLYFEGPPTWAPAWLENAPAAITAGGVGIPDEAWARATVIDGEIVDPAEGLLSEMLTWDQLADQEPPEPLIHGLLDRATVAYLIGKPGSMKTFVAMSFAACVATGRDWIGHRVERAPVVYLMAEGQRGGAMRARAWRQHYGWSIEDVRFLRRPVQANGPEWLDLIKVCQRIQPGLIILDTQAKITVGMEENSNTEMGVFIARAEMLKYQTGACVLIIHHIGRSGDSARGASSIDGAQDTEIKVERVGRKEDLRVRLNLDKQKDGPDTEVVEFAAKLVDLGTHPVTGRALSSLVVQMDAWIDPIPRKPWLDGLAENQSRILDVLHEHFRELGATKAELYAAVQERFGEMKRTTFATALDRLAQTDKVAKIYGTQRFVSVAAREAGT